MWLYHLKINRIPLIHKVRCQTQLKNVYHLTCIYSEVKLLYTATDGYNNHFSLFFELTQDVCQKMTLNFLCWKFHLKLGKYTECRNRIVITIHMKSTTYYNHTPPLKNNPCSLKITNSLLYPGKLYNTFFVSSSSFQSSSN